MEAKIDNIRTVLNSSVRTVKVGEQSGDRPVMVATTALADFRATVTNIHYNDTDTHVTLDARTAAALKVSEGDSVSIATL